MRTSRRELLAVGGAALLSLAASGTVSANASSHNDWSVTLVEPEVGDDFNYPYYLAVPPAVDEEPRPVLVEPNNTGEVTDDFDEHLDRAESDVNSGQSRTLAGELGTPFVVPVFPRTREDPVDSDHYTHALDDTTLRVDAGPLERIDLQLLAMVADARDRVRDTGQEVADGILLNGFSASGNFVDRFAALHPDEVIAVSAGGVNGMPILPIKEAAGHSLPFHVGIADGEEFIDRPIDPEGFADVNRFLYMGEFDGSDTLPFSDAFTDSELQRAALDVFGQHMINDRFAYARSVYREVGASAVFRVYEGAGHDPRPAADDVVEFHERSLDGDHIDDIRADLGGNEPELGAHIEPDRKLPAVGDEVVFDASRSVLDGTEISEYEWRFDDGDTATGVTTERTFDEPGGHVVELRVTDDAGNTHTTTHHVVVGDHREPLLREDALYGAAPDETQLSLIAPPGGGQQRLDVEYAVPTHVTDEDQFRIRVFDGPENEITDGPLFDYVGTADIGEVVLERPVEEGETITVALLPSGVFDLDEVFAVVEAEVGPAVESLDAFGPRLVDADPNAGFEYPYFLYAPATTQRPEPRPILVETNNTGQSDDDFEPHLNDADSRITSGIGRNVADGLGVPFLVPAFPRPRSIDAGVHALDALTLGKDNGDLERVDLQLLAMVEDARDRLADHGLDISDELLLNGFSASGNFLDRFAALHPDQVLSLTAGGLNGMPILPTDEAVDMSGEQRELPYHVGVSDLTALTGSGFDLDAFADINRFLYMGELDMNDTIPFDDAFTHPERGIELRDIALDVYGTDMHRERFPFARAVDADHETNAVYRSYPLAGHDISPAETDVMLFHLRSMADAGIDDLRAEFGGGVPNQRAAVECVPTDPYREERVVFDASATTHRTGNPEEFEWEFDDGTTATGEAVVHRFEEPGRHEVTLRVQDGTGAVHESTEHIWVTDEAAPTVSAPENGENDEDESAADGQTDSGGETAADDEDDTRGDGDSATADDSVPGFGLVQAVSAAGGVGYLLSRMYGSDGESDN